MLLAEERKAITQACTQLTPDGLVIATAGNMSVRCGDLIAITPSGLPYDELTPELVSVVDAATGQQVEGPLKPASEVDLHLATYRATGLGAVLHTHSMAATAVASLEGIDVLPAVHYYICMFGGHDVKIADYAIYGSAELAANVEEALRGRSAALMRNHGCVVAGEDLRTAYDRALELEWLCELYLRTHTAGSPRLLSPAQVQAVSDKIRSTGYGQHAPSNDQAPQA